MSVLAPGYDPSVDGNAPIPHIADTLASICRAHHQLSAEVRPFQSSVASGERPATTALTSRQASRQGSRQASRQSQKGTPRLFPPEPGHAGRPRSSDKRGYNSLEELLDIAVPDAAATGAQSARSVLGRRGTPVAMNFRSGDLLGDKSWGSSEPRKLEASSARGVGATSPIPVGKAEGSRSRPQTHTGVKKRGKKNAGGDAPPISRKGKRDTAELPLIAHEVEAKVLKDLEIDMTDVKVSDDWSTMFSLVHHKAPQRQVALQTDADAGPSRAVASREGPRSNVLEDRPPSPFRPGVYSGNNKHSGANHVPKVLRMHGGPGKPAAAEAATAQAAGLVNQSQPQKDAQKNGWQRPRFDPVSLAKINRLETEAEDEKLAEERRQYALWKKRVIESARTLHLEVNRFQSLCDD